MRFQAYSVDELVRTYVISQRQKQAVEADEKRMTDYSDPVNDNGVGLRVSWRGRGQI